MFLDDMNIFTTNRQDRAGRTKFVANISISVLFVFAILCSTDAFSFPRAVFLQRNVPGSRIQSMLHNRNSKIGERSISKLRPRMSMEFESLASPQNFAMLMAFADQGSNLAGKFFQGSLLPYLGFLVFLKNSGRVSMILHIRRLSSGSQIANK